MSMNSPICQTLHIIHTVYAYTVNNYGKMHFLAISLDDMWFMVKKGLFMG